MIGVLIGLGLAYLLLEESDGNQKKGGEKIEGNGKKSDNRSGGNTDRKQRAASKTIDRAGIVGLVNGQNKVVTVGKKDQKGSCRSSGKWEKKTTCSKKKRGEVGNAKKEQTKPTEKQGRDIQKNTEKRKKGEKKVK